MFQSSTISLGALRLQAQDRADLQNSNLIPTAMWNQYISQSYKTLYDLLVSAYGNDYYVATAYQFTIDSTQLYDLPDDFYKLLGVDLQYSASPSGWVTLKRFEFIERNRYSWLQPIPISAATVQLWYIPKPTSLQYLIPCVTTVGSVSVTVPDASVITVGMTAYGDGLQSNTTVTAVNTTTNAVTLSLAALATQPVAMLYFWIDSTNIDGIAGWEEFIIIDAAIKANIKQEQDVADLRVQRQEMVERIQAMAEGRDAGQAHHVSDVLSVNAPILSIGATSLKYRPLGSQIQFVPCGSSDLDDGGSGYGF